MKSTLFVANAFEDILDMVVHGSYSIKPVFYNRSGELVVVIEVCSVGIKAIETSISREFLASSG